MGEYWQPRETPQFNRPKPAQVQQVAPTPVDFTFQVEETQWLGKRMIAIIFKSPTGDFRVFAPPAMATAIGDRIKLKAAGLHQADTN